MIIFQRLSLVLLWLLVALGLYGAISISYNTVTNTSPCPNIIGLPICYLVLTGYAAMFASLFMLKSNKHKWLFYLGWSIVFLIAVAGSSFEILKGNVCPKNSSGLPLCYLSLAFTVAILLLYYLQQKLRTFVIQINKTEN